ncbi:histidinol-phosphate aminotransferase [Forsythia ovata]|uniref:histidinol-phosphate transaminase n=1 Tax=Forsythia ovata TaxID=205694 RepID=A0ABD1TPB8_9LAMI
MQEAENYITDTKKIIKKLGLQRDKQKMLSNSGNLNAKVFESSSSYSPDIVTVNPCQHGVEILISSFKEEGFPLAKVLTELLGRGLNVVKLIIDDETLLKILALPVLVVLDEAYVEFSGVESRMGWVKKYENLIVLRTFSKRAGLAGLRVGYGAFPLSIIEYLWRAKQPYNVSVAAEISACAALKNPVYLEVP